MPQSISCLDALKASVQWLLFGNWKHVVIFVFFRLPSKIFNDTSLLLKKTKHISRCCFKFCTLQSNTHLAVSANKTVTFYCYCIKNFAKLILTKNKASRTEQTMIPYSFNKIQNTSKNPSHNVVNFY